MTSPFTFTAPDLLADLGGNAERFRWNVRVLRLLQTLEAEQRGPTAEEQTILAHYTAFGNSELLQRAVYIARGGTYAAQDELADLITPEEAATIARGALTQYFTPLPLALLLGGLVERVLDGVASPRLLEPAAGIGMLVAALPPALRERADITAVELDHVASKVFQRLHPDVRFFGSTAFQDVELPVGVFDVTISNVPFGAVRVTDPLFGRSETALTRTLHDFFLAKMLKLTRPGGYCIALTSYGTLDKKASGMRAWLANHAHLVAALRLPNGVFVANSGSVSGCDLLILRRKPVADDESPLWVESVRTALPDGMPACNAVTSQVLEYGLETQLSPLFQPGSPHLLGTYVAFDSSARTEAKRFYVINPPAEPLPTLLAQRLAAIDLPHVPVDANLHTDGGPICQHMVTATGPEAQILPDAQQRNPQQQARIAAAQAVLTALSHLTHAELHVTDEADVEHARAALNQRYDAFVAAYGCLHSAGNQKALGTVLLEYPKLLALEVNVRQIRGTPQVEKAPIFFTRVVAPRPTAIPGTFTLDEALTWCLSERVTVDISTIALLAGMPEADVVAALHGRIYRDLSGREGGYVLKEELCSGNIHAKLLQARGLAALDPTYQEHVALLEAAMPTPLTRDQISLELGNAIIPPELIAAFLGELVPAFRTYGGAVVYHPAVNAWKITTPRQARTAPQALAWSTARKNCFDLFDAAIHQRELVVRDEYEDADGTLRTCTNQAETLAAGVMIAKLKETFVQWLWADEERAAELERRYNAERNIYIERRFDGAHLQLVGLNTSGLRRGDADPHQKDVIWRILASPVTYIAHPVGSGKTLMMVAGIAESIRRGLARKALVVVPNSLVGQWAGDLIRFYPNLRVLAMTAKDFAKQRRQRFLALATTGSWDVVVVGQTSFTRLPLPRAARRRFYQEEIDALRDYLADTVANDTRPDKEKKRDRALKRIDARVEKLEAKLKEIDARIERDDERLYNLVEMGFDMLVVDEFHQYKNLEFSTTKTGIAGLPNGGSERAFDMWQKVRHFRARGCKVVVASATPIANTLCEAYVNQKFLQWELLQAMGLAHFDQWAAQFAKPTQSFELRPDANGFRVVTRMSQFINLPELHQLTRQVTDVRLEEQLNLPRPAIITGRPVPVVVPASQQLKDYIQMLGQRADAIRLGLVDPEDDNMLKIASDGRKAALDPRLVGGTRDAGCKIDVLAQHVVHHYHECNPWRGTQLIFCDLGTPRGR
jgi:N12 class adenine-specific DNA methylase